MHWRCWLGSRKGIRPVKNWVVGCWHGYLSGAKCRLTYGPADATATLASVKSRLVLPFWYWLTRVVPDKGPLNGCVCVSVFLCITTPSCKLYCTFLTKLEVTVHQSLDGCALPHLSEYCVLISSAGTQQHLRSADSHLVAVTHFRLNTHGQQPFSAANPMAWNSPEFIQEPTISTDSFRHFT